MLCLPPRNGTILRSACCIYISIMSLMEYWQAVEELLSEIRTHCFSIRERNFNRSKVNAVPLAGRKTHHAWVLISDLLISKVATIVRPLYYFIYLLLFFE